MSRLHAGSRALCRSSARERRSLYVTGGPRDGTASRTGGDRASQLGTERSQQGLLYCVLPVEKVSWYLSLQALISWSVTLFDGGANFNVTPLKTTSAIVNDGINTG